ncbi:OmpA family protein [Treponema bryantii]|uniref:OmpA family protein n=1 Tax=Treponema bryantii TaxID=163 RepID=A0A1H9HXL2_9SPIR|nr:OmpA family protein [Treponema bryantii]SEQ66997.1 OmpA family protein [Treponema bryantii]
MKRLSVTAILLFITFSLFADEGILFEFKQKKGDAVSHVATVEEEAYINGRLNNRTEFINRTSTTVTETQQDGSAKLFTHYMTTQNNFINSTGRMLSWGEENSVRVYRDANGQLHDSDNDYLPTVQSVPSFSDEKIKIGESWTSKGLEVHDCRELFNMEEAIQVPFTATYTYIGDEETDDKILRVLEVQYKFFQDNLSENNYNSDCTYAGTHGQAIQKIWWDNERGELDHYTEEFVIYMYDTYNNTFAFRGTAHGEVTDYKSVNDKNNLKKLQKKVEKYKLDNISVKQGDKGLTISLDAIQFEPDSVILLPSEKKKIEKLGEILKEFSNDLLITGHCADRGTVKMQQKLSEERADAVAEFLVQLGIRDQYHVFTQGKGATEPVATNSTEAGRVKNRRVEITIMD